METAKTFVITVIRYKLADLCVNFHLGPIFFIVFVMTVHESPHGCSVNQWFSTFGKVKLSYNEHARYKQFLFVIAIIR